MRSFNKIITICVLTLGSLLFTFSGNAQIDITKRKVTLDSLNARVTSVNVNDSLLVHGSIIVDTSITVDDYVKIGDYAGNTAFSLILRNGITMFTNTLLDWGNGNARIYESGYNLHFQTYKVGGSVQPLVLTPDTTYIKSDGNTVADFQSDGITFTVRPGSASPAKLQITNDGSILKLLNPNSLILIQDQIQTETHTPRLNNTYNSGSTSKYWATNFSKTVRTSQLAPDDSNKVTFNLGGTKYLEVGLDGTRVKLNSSEEFNLSRAGVLKFRLETTQIKAFDDFVPSSSNIYNLGAGTNCWKDLYVSGSIKSCGGNIAIDPFTTITNGCKVNGYSQNSASKTANYTATFTDNLILADGSSSSVDIALPNSGAYQDKVYTIKAIDITNSVTISSSGCDIDGASLPYSFSTANEAITVQLVGTTWQIISKYIPGT